MKTTAKLLALAALLALAVAVCLLLRPDGKDELVTTVRSSVEDRAAGPAGIAGSDDAAGDASGEAAAPDREEPAAAPDITPLPPVVEFGPNEALVNVTVLTRKGGPPARDVFVVLLPETHCGDADRHRFLDLLETQGLGRKDGKGDSVRFTFSESCAPDAAGRTSVRVPRGIPFKLVVRREKSFLDYEDVCSRHIGALAAGERRDVTLYIEPETFSFYGRVITRGPGRTPISGASIFCSHGEEPDAVSDSAGFFLLLLLVEFPRPATISARGFGPAVISPCEGHETAANALLIELEAAAAVFGTITGPEGPALGAEIVLSASPHELLQGDERLHNWPNRSPRWTATSTAAGAYRVEGLPPHASLRVDVALPGQSSRRMPEPITLGPGEERRADFNLAALATLLGRVVDQDGAPVAGAGILVQPPEDSRSPLAEGRPYLVEPIDFVCTTTTVTDEAGEFVAAALAPGPWAVAVQTNKAVWGESESVIESTSGWNVYESPTINETIKTAGATRDLTDLTPVEQLVVIPEGVDDVRITLQVHRGLYITGRVLAPGPARLVHRQVLAARKDGMGSSRADCDGDGCFKVGPLLPGNYVLQATGFLETGNAMVRSGKVETCAGDGNVVLALQRSAALRGRVTGGAGRLGRDAEIQVWSREDGVGTFQPIRQDGSFEFADLSPGVHDLFARDGRGNVAYCLGALATADPAPPEVILAWQPAGVVAVTLDGSDTPAALVVQRDGRTLAIESLAPGAPTTVSVPLGRITLHIRRPGDEREPSREVDVIAGERKEIRFDLSR